MNLVIDLFLLWIINLIWPEKRSGGQEGEWAIFSTFDDHHSSIDDSDPYINGDYDDGPDW